MTAISYESNSLQDNGIVTSNIIFSPLPRNIIKSYIAGRSKSRFFDDGYPERTIKVSGSFTADSQLAAQQLEDTLRGYLVGTDGQLDIEQAGATRRYVATPNYVEIDRPGGLLFGLFSVDFECSIPFGRDTSSTSLATATAYTSATKTTAVTIGGTAEYQHLVLEVTINSGTGLSGETITLGNGLNGQEISVTRTWSALDVLLVDSYNNVVTVNGDEVAFTGALPIFNTGSGSVTYADTFTTRNIDIDISQYKLWA